MSVSSALIEVGVMSIALVLALHGGWLKAVCEW